MMMLHYIFTVTHAIITGLIKFECGLNPKTVLRLAIKVGIIKDS